MNKLHYIFFSLLLAMSACDNSEIVDSEPKLMTRSAVTDFSYFNNIEQTKYEGGYNWISGDIYCEREATYTFILAFNATGNVSCEASIGATPLIRLNNGSDFQTITRVLQPGINHCYVRLFLTGENQQGYARLVITKINSSAENQYVGDSVDLVASGSR